jgi:Na+-transporting NADH:ubiquinone oxidoreductase subunit C
MKNFSNRYIYIYSIVLALVVAAVLAVVAVVLKPYQQKNIEAEQMQQLLASAGINVERTEAETNYAKYITKEFTVNNNGEIVDEYSDGKQTKGTDRPFSVSVKAQYKQYKAGAQAKLPVYICKKDNGELVYIVPVRGAGLWGDIWGNVALKSDLNTIEGVTFDHESETPGLGSKIKDDPSFVASFKNKTIYDNDSFVSVEVKKRAGNADPHKVDALSGATLTSNGVSSMLKDCLTFYLPYFKTLKK